MALRAKRLGGDHAIRAKRQKIFSVKLCVHSVKLCVRLITCLLAAPQGDK